MNNIQNYGNNYNVTSNRNVISPNFKAYNLKAIQEGIKLGRIPTDTIIKEMETDLKAMDKNKNFDDISKVFDLSNALVDIGKIKLKGNKAELQLKMHLQKLALKTAKPEEKIAIQQSIEKCEEGIKKIDAYLEA